MFAALLTRGPLHPACIRAQFLPCWIRSIRSRERFSGQSIHRLSHPTDFRSFSSLPGSTLFYRSRVIRYTEPRFQLLEVSKLIFYLFLFLSPFGAETIVSFSRAPFTSASGRFTPAWLPGSCCSCNPERGLPRLLVLLPLCCFPSGIRNREDSCSGPTVQL